MNVKINIIIDGDGEELLSPETKLVKLNPPSC